MFGPRRLAPCFVTFVLVLPAVAQGDPLPSPTGPTPTPPAPPQMAQSPGTASPTWQTPPAPPPAAQPQNQNAPPPAASPQYGGPAQPAAPPQYYVPPYRPAVSAAPMPPDTRFGQAGQFVLDADFKLSISHTSLSYMGQSVSQTEIEVAPGFSYFVTDNFFIGAIAGLGYLSSEGNSQTTINIGPSLGVNINASDIISFAPAIAVVYLHFSTDADGASVSGYQVPLGITAPVLFHIRKHFFLGIGPFAAFTMVSKVEGEDAPKTTVFGLSSTIGVWW
jgi:hypothetical protein